MAVIEARELSKRYGHNEALKRVSFQIEEGEIVGLIGPNGAGKSTAMNILCGYLPPTSGSVHICGTDMQQDPQKARRYIGYLPETPPVYADMTVEEQVRFACALSGMKKGKEMEETVQALCEKTGITHMRRRLIRSLSKGYRQRVALSQLLAGDPQILVLDEPTVGLDPRQIREFRDLFLELGKTHTVIFSSHILSEINSICDRVLIFESGELLADGRPEDLQKGLQEDTRIHLLVTGSDEMLLEKLRALPGVAEITQTPHPVMEIAHTAGATAEIKNTTITSEREGPGAAHVTCHDLTIRFADMQPDLHALNDVLRSCGCDVWRLEREQLSLEDIYLRILRKREEKRE